LRGAYQAPDKKESKWAGLSAGAAACWPLSVAKAHSVGVSDAIDGIGKII